uniref:Uncharacterized protein n=1 Tax=Rhizobium meliloti TaxID=382 RepID=I2E1Y0_RHIML|nr:short hypothetical protein [Sinorhizobium meliloti]AFJ91498.1 short hypothetical protein [Sinorhizobium meliloti]
MAQGLQVVIEGRFGGDRVVWHRPALAACSGTRRDDRR